MAYQLTVEKQRKYSYDDFARMVQKIEKEFTEDVSKCYSGRCIWVLLDGAYETNYFEKTTVSDLRSVMGDINFDCIINTSAVGNTMLYSIREPTKKAFRGKIKYTPKGTISVSQYYIAPDKNGKMGIGGTKNLPFLQDEKFVNTFCDNAYNNDEQGVDYEYLEKHAFIALANDRRFKCGDDWEFTTPGVTEEISRNLHRIICNMYDVEESWGICYEYNGNVFMFPMRREYIKEIFKKRDPENGRRKTLAAIVGGYERKDGTQVDGHLRSAQGFTIDGRDYSLLEGAEDLARMYPNTMKSYKRLKKKYDRLEQIGNTRFAVLEEA